MCSTCSFYTNPCTSTPTLAHPHQPLHIHTNPCTSTPTLAHPHQPLHIHTNPCTSTPTLAHPHQPLHIHTNPCTSTPTLAHPHQPLHIHSIRFCNQYIPELFQNYPWNTLLWSTEIMDPDCFLYVEFICFGRFIKKMVPLMFHLSSPSWFSQVW